MVERHQSRVFSIAWRILADSATAEEVAQDVFLELYRSLSKIDSDDHLLAWLRRTTCHRATDALRRRAARGSGVTEEFREEQFREGLLPMPLTRTAPLMNRIEELVYALPAPQRDVVLMRYQEDLEPEEIAGTLSMPIATVRSHLQRAVKLLRSKAQRTLQEYIRG